MNISALTVGFDQSQETLGEAYPTEAYLGFQLDEKTKAVFSMEQVQEVIVVPADHISLMPNMPDCVLGLMTRRNRVMWAVDLAQMLLSQPLPINVRQYKVIIIRVKPAPKQQNMLLASFQSQALLGLIVQEVTGGIRLAPDLIQSPQGSISSYLTPYLRGCLMQGNSMQLVLDAEAIAYSSTLQSN
ncbi:MAG: chemotaxis protein CheW [Symploca sp. SIO3C6]|uniref:Chemotaxis protein CheW n=1 Tax=Symploca sp. SIO1C4 TaxID=2607765 RepID=A0A6B3NJ62_9CYAN|nr:chemotaxis protein CheW [Symploca sp. SIO3C6]NER30925.1 chemotaxis protein CheW [Symploca sp. SIO1C4]NET04264.1 chemotaxis protein CheW [Symploca sp. SIO2B6]